LSWPKATNPAWKPSPKANCRAISPPPSGSTEARTYAATHAYAETFDQDHGRREWRRIWVGPTDPFATNFASAAQLLRIERHVWKGAAVEPAIEVVFGLTSRAASAATPDQLLAAVREHWGAIENGHHHRRDRTYREDQSPVRDPNATPCYAALRAVAILDVILRDEIGHVAIGNHWYRYLCAQRRLDPVAHYALLAQQYSAPRIKGPLNLDARRKAGFDAAELALLDA